MNSVTKEAAVKSCHKADVAPERKIRTSWAEAKCKKCPIFLQRMLVMT